MNFGGVIAFFPAGGFFWPVTVAKTIRLFKLTLRVNLGGRPLTVNSSTVIRLTCKYLGGK